MDYGRSSICLVTHVPTIYNRAPRSVNALQGRKVPVVEGLNIRTYGSISSPSTAVLGSLCDKCSLHNKTAVHDYGGCIALCNARPDRHTDLTGCGAWQWNRPRIPTYRRSLVTEADAIQQPLRPILSTRRHGSRRFTRFNRDT